MTNRLGRWSGIADEYRLVIALFLRLLALIYLAAFVSLGLQIVGLVGAEGILPFGEQLEYLSGELGQRACRLVPTVFWLDSSDLALQGAAVAGCLFSVLLLFGRLTRLSLICLFVLYLSLVQAGQLFCNFQWDYLLLEAGFLAIFLPGRSRLVVWLFRWLLFRLRFLSGASKLLSGDPSWAGLTALNYYFETQPLPHTLSWYAHLAPDWLLKTLTAGVLGIELVVPFMMFLPRPYRLFAAWATILTQVAILLTSNHNFFNLLTIVLCLFLLDDRALTRMLPRRLRPAAEPEPPAVAPKLWKASLLGMLAIVLVGVSAAQMWEMLARRPLPGPLAQVVEQVNAFRVVNKYHVFPTIKTERLELEIQGSYDGEHWLTYGFRYKPGPLDRRPEFIVPHQPRLDWMLWFVPGRHPMNLMWFERFAQRLLENSPPVTGLLEHNPFADAPPRQLRVQLWRYRFTTAAERAATGNWWAREWLGPFFPLAWFQRTSTLSHPILPDQTPPNAPRQGTARRE